MDMMKVPMDVVLPEEEEELVVAGDVEGETREISTSQQTAAAEAAASLDLLSRQKVPIPRAEKQPLEKEEMRGEDVTGTGRNLEPPLPRAVLPTLPPRLQIERAGWVKINSRLVIVILNICGQSQLRTYPARIEPITLDISASPPLTSVMFNLPLRVKLQVRSGLVANAFKERVQY